MAVQNQLILGWLNGKLSLEKYQRLMSYPGWNYFTQSIKATRAFENGLDACLILLQYTEDIRDDLSVADYERNLQTLYFFLLTMLDRLDRWGDYLSYVRTCETTHNSQAPMRRAVWRFTATGFNHSSWETMGKVFAFIFSMEFPIEGT